MTSAANDPLEVASTCAIFVNGVFGATNTLVKPLVATDKPAPFKDGIAIAYAYTLPSCNRIKKLFVDALIDLMFLGSISEGSATFWNGLAPAFVVPGKTKLVFKYPHTQIPSVVAST